MQSIEPNEVALNLEGKSEQEVRSILEETINFVFEGFELAGRVQLAG